MTPADITALGVALYGEPWLEKTAVALGYSTSQLYRVVYDGAPVTRRMQRELDKLAKRKKTKALNNNDNQTNGPVVKEEVK